jgi:putative phosphoribosyl transferase
VVSPDAVGETSYMESRFRDRGDAGRQLALALRAYAHGADLVVLALPRGGVPVGFEVAMALAAPLEVFVVRKLGVPWHDELAMGAIASGGVRILDHEIIRAARVTEDDIERVTAVEQVELERREQLYRGDRPFPDVRGRTVILVDDGLATGSTMLAAVEAIRMEEPARIVVAVPVASPDTCRAFREIVDEMVCVETPDPFQAVGLWYLDFSQTTDEEVHELLDRSRAAPGTIAPR